MTEAQLKLFGLKRAHPAAILWPLDTALGVLFHLHTPEAWAVHQEAIRLLKETIREQTFAQAKGTFDERLEALEKQVKEYSSAFASFAPYMARKSSGAGSTLAAQAVVARMLKKQTTGPTIYNKPVSRPKKARL